MNTKTFFLHYFLVAILLVCSTAINADKSTIPQSTESMITPVTVADPVPYSTELYCCYSWGAQICSLGYGSTDRRGAPCTCGNVHGTVC